jgi:RHS repeat-associated protein
MLYLRNLSYKYEAYGRVTIYDERGKEKNKSKFKNRYLFTGREYDSETGLYYYRARYYSAKLGRFLQRDTEELDDLFSLYAYCLNNPINYTDPLGLFYAHDHMSITKSAAKDEDFNEETSMALANANADSDLDEDYKDKLDRHANRTPPQTAGEAIAAAKASIENDMKEAIESLKSCRTKETIKHLGRALHTIQDIVIHDGRASDSPEESDNLGPGHDANLDGYHKGKTLENLKQEAKNKTQEALKDFDKRAKDAGLEEKLKKMKKAYGFIRCGGIFQGIRYIKWQALGRGWSIIDQAHWGVSEIIKGFTKCGKKEPDSKIPMVP